MGLFDRFPYTNFHELNLDWIIAHIKGVEEAKEIAKQSAEQASADATRANNSATSAELSATTAATAAETATQKATEAARSAAGIEDARQQIYTNTQRLDQLIVDGTPTQGNSELIDIRTGYNGTVYQTAGTAVRSQITDLHDALDELSGQEDYTVTWTTGGYVSDETGEIATSETWRYTNLLEIKNGLVITFEGTSEDKYNAFYDQAGNFIRNFVIPPLANKFSVPIPTNAKFARISWGTGTNVYIHNALVSVAEIGRIEEKNSANINFINGFPVDYPIEWTNGGYINSDTGAVVTNASWKYSDFIALRDTRPIYVSTNKNVDNVYNAFYDASHNFIQRLYISAFSDRAEINLPNNAKYIRLSCENQYYIEVSPSLDSLEEIAERVSALETGMSAPLPDYYTSYMESKNATVNSKMDAIDNCYAFIYFTDPHIKQNAMHSPAMMENILANTGISEVICGGDIISAYDTEAGVMSDCDVYRAAWGKLQPYFTRGNHDIYAKETENTNTGIIKPNSMVVNRFMRPYHSDMVKPSGKTYYYTDRPDNKIRMIFIDTNEIITGAVVDNVWNPSYAITQSQVDWFINVLSGTPAGYKIVVSNHAPIVSQLPWALPLAYIFGDIIDAYNARGAINETNDQGIRAQADFSSAAGSVILSICGHGHVDAVYTSATGCVYYEVNCDCLLNNGGSEYERTAGTVSEQSFDVVIINADNGHIDTVRYGAGVNKTLRN